MAFTQDYDAVGRRLRAAVEAGELTGERDPRAVYGEGGPGKDIDWEGLEKRIEGAVERGDMTRDQADAKHEAIRERMAGRRER